MSLGTKTRAAVSAVSGYMQAGLVKLIKLYQYTAPVRRQRCRYLPTCSHYAVEAIEVHRARGVWLAIKRVGRCHPFGSFGLDPVPEPGETGRRKKVDLKDLKMGAEA